MSGIGSRTLRGAAWAYTSFVGGRLLVLGSMAILARLLSPRQFGVIGFAMAFLAFIDTLQDLGLTQALVVYRGRDVLVRADSVFTASVAIGAAMWLLTFGLAPLSASFFHQSLLLEIVPVLGLNFLIKSLGSTHYALAQRQLDFRSRAIAETADVLLRGATGVVLALLGLGVWSLVLGYVVGTIVLAMTMMWLVPWRPRVRLRRAHLQGMIGFGGTLAMIEIISAGIANLDYLFVGKILGASALGLYTIGYRLPELMIVNLSVVAGLAMFPAFSQVQPEALRHAYLVAFRYTLMLSAPMTVGMLVLARPLVLALFGAKWEPAIGPMRVLALFALAITIDIPAGTVYKAIGKANVILRLAVPRLVLLVVGLALFTHAGIVPAAACQTVIAVCFAAIGLGLAWRLLGAGPRLLWGEARPVVAATLLMGAVALAVQWPISSPWLALVICVPLGAAVYVLALLCLAPHTISDLLAKLAPGRFSPRVPASA